MSNINKVIITGNLTKNAELKQLQSGTPVLRGGIAVNESRKNQQGQWEEVPNFFDFTIFGRRAEALAQYMTKGLKVCLQGRLHYSAWKAQDGTNRSRVDINVEEVELMSRGNQSASNAPQGGQSNNYPPRQQNGYQGGYNAPQQGYQPQQAAYADEDIPF